MLVSQNMAKREAPIKRASRHSEAPHRQIQQLGNLNVLRPGPAPGLTLLMQQNLKRLMKWFSCWHAWQRRMVVCRMLDSCPPAQLTSLATALEPVLHLDFCSSLAPLKAALHHEGLEIFVVQRATNSYQFQQWNTEAQGFRQALHKPEKVKQYLSKSAQFPAHSSQEENEELISKKPAQTVASLPILRSSIEKEELHHVRPPVFLPTLEMMHSRHKVSPASSDYRHPSDLQEEKETLVLPLLTLQHKYNSVPDFRNNSDLLQHIKLVGSQDHHRKSKSLGVHLQDHTRRRPRKARTSNKTRHLELYKKQLGLVSQVDIKYTHYLFFSLLFACSFSIMFQ